MFVFFLVTFVNCILYLFLDLQRKGRGQGGGVLYNNGNNSGNVSGMYESETNPTNSPRQIRRKRRLHERRIPERDKRANAL